MTIRNIIFKNLGLRIVALFLAVFVWAMITGKERAYSEKTVEVNVEYYGVAPNIDIRSVIPDKIRVKLRGISKELDKIDTDDLRIRVDMRGIRESTLLSLYSENLLEYPENIEILSVHPKRIEITAVELITREVDIRVRYKGRMKPGVTLLDRQLVPEKAKIYGYKSQIMNIDVVEAAEWVNLEEIEESRIIRLPLKKGKEILKFEGPNSVEVHLTVENRNKPKNQDEKNKENQKKENKENIPENRNGKNQEQ
jgi:YbbR domain-containing protein